jgi:gamma-glutamyltranspeptidase
MVVSGDAAATDAGLAVLKSGGNAMDAAAAMAFVPGVPSLP